VIYLAHRRAETYPEPERFRPERWPGARVDPHAWLPFGGGTRRCLGMAFALAEMKLVLATLRRRARLAPASDRPTRVVRRTITLAPSGGARAVLVARRPR
jgi:cytochrome P450